MIGIVVKMVSIFSPNGAEIPIWFEATGPVVCLPQMQAQKTQIFELLCLHPTWTRLHKTLGFRRFCHVICQYTLTNTLHHFAFFWNCNNCWCVFLKGECFTWETIHANLVAPTSKPPLTCDWLSWTCRMFAATGWKFEYIFREMRFQSAGEMTYKPGPKPKERSAHVLLRWGGEPVDR